MAFNRPSIKEIVDRVKVDFNLRLTGSNETLKFTLANVFSYVIAGASHLLHGHLDFISRMAMPDTAEDLYIERHGEIWGIKRKPQTYAYGNVKFLGSDGFSVDIGTLLKGANGVEYQTEESGFVVAGELILKVIAKTPGSTGNLAELQTLNLVNPIPGIGTEASIESPGINEGTNVESDQSFKDRIIDRVRNPISGGTVADYKRWTLEIPGVTRAWVFPLYQGPGTVGVTFVQDENLDIIPNSLKIDEVAEYLDERRPITAEVNIFAPQTVEIDFNIVVTPDTPEVRSAIEGELKDLIRREASPGKPLLLTKIHEAISISSGEEDHVLNSPTEDIIFLADEIAVFGAITWP